MTKKISTAAAVVLFAGFFAWCSAPAADAPSKDTLKKAAEKAPPKAAQTAAPSPTAKAAQAFDKVSKELYPKAKQEGNLIIYSVWDVEHLRAITDAFMKRYPGIKTTYWQGRNPEIVTRVLTEFQGGQASVDVILSDNAPPVVRAAGAIANYETVQKDVLHIHDPTMATVSLQIQALTYNTKKLKPADLPKSWEDVANPKYKGMVALDDPMRAGPLSSMLAGLSARRSGSQEHQRHVPAGNRRRVCDLHAGTAP
ncbi:MAG: extracellular solute-binding protein family 1 [Deltaproteobacteria bacterium]|nr:extracellular solute-binding protein family 1 [Deltaproteobacteria bacterium]